MNKVEIINQTNTKIDFMDDLNKVINCALKNQSVDNAMFNIILVDIDTIHKINKEYRKIDRPTDVITFALEDDSSFVKLDVRVLGDIYICIERAISQAEEYGHSFKRELCFLTVHGILHLLGYDHMEKEEEKEMFHLQEMILDECQIKRGN